MQVELQQIMVGSVRSIYVSWALDGRLSKPTAI
jgi:hypothetical protein